MTIFLTDPGALLAALSASTEFALMASASATTLPAIIFCLSAELVAARSSRRSILHFGHLPRLVDFTSGCIGQTYDFTCFVVVFFCSELCSGPPVLENACASTPIPPNIITVSTNALQSLDLVRGSIWEIA